MAEPTRRGFWPLRDLPALFWLLLVGVSAVLHPFLPAPRWLLVHLLLLGAVSHSILVWSRHFADAMLHTAPRPGDRRWQSIRLLLLNGGVSLVVAGVLLARWPLTAIGAGAVIAAVGWHGVVLATMMRRALPSRFGATVRYYVAAAALLPVGATLGILLARNPAQEWHDRMLLAHAAVNLLGWVGLTVLGTLVTLWPTILRTRIADGAERASRRAHPILVGSVLVVVGASLAGQRWGIVLGLVGYLAGVVVTGRALVLTARAKPPGSYAGLSVGAAMVWLVGGLAALAIGVAFAPEPGVAAVRFDWLAPFLVAGFAGQVLIGALSYLVPVTLGGGPTPVRAASERLDAAAWLRITVINSCLLLCALPVPSLVRVLGSVAILAAFLAFVVLLVSAIRVSRRARADRTRLDRTERRRPAEPVPGRRSGMVALALAVFVLVVSGGVALEPAAVAGGDSAADGVATTGQTTAVTVTARDMRFVPDRIEVPAGNRLLIEVVNADDADVHDLVLESGASTRRLAPGERDTLEVPVAGQSLDGWCSIAGHRQLGMVLEVLVTGAPADGDAHHDSTSDQPGPGEEAPVIDFAAEPGPDFTAHDPTLPPVDTGTVHEYTFRVQEGVAEVAPGVTQHLWTFNGSAPGPALHGRVGDTFEITLVNDGSMGHSVDFHAGSVAPDDVMRTIPPGDSLVYRFTAERAGIWMYHCSTMPMSAHIANGMFGAVVIDPPDLPEVDREYLLLQSEFYLGPEGEPVDPEKVAAETPDAVVFNGYVNQYDHRPLQARAGERVRIWVLDAGPNRDTSFHVVGGQFDTVYAEGAYVLSRGDGGSQALALGAAQGGFVELTFEEPGHYPFVSHRMVDAERGAHGILEVTD